MSNVYIYINIYIYMFMYMYTFAPIRGSCERGKVRKKKYV